MPACSGTGQTYCSTGLLHRHAAGCVPLVGGRAGLCWFNVDALVVNVQLFGSDNGQGRRDALTDINLTGMHDNPAFVGKLDPLIDSGMINNAGMFRH